MPSLVVIDTLRFAYAQAVGTYSGDLTAAAFTRYHLALSHGAWARNHRRLLALADGGNTLLATASRHERGGTLDGAPVRICVIGEIAESTPGSGHARQLIERLLDDATTHGFHLAVLHAAPGFQLPERLHRVQTACLTLRVTESLRRGAPMAPVRSGDRGDLAVIAALPSLDGTRRRLEFERGADYLDFVITRRRLRAGLACEGLRQLLFFVVEEGMRAAAYAVISVVGTDWVVELCGDQDRSGARVGALLQALITCEPAERRPSISAWLPAGFVPPQVTVISSEPASDGIWLCSLAGNHLPLSAEDVTFWRGDLP